MKYRLKRISDTLHKVQLGRDGIGWCRKVEGQPLFAAEARGERGVGPTAAAAFHELVRALNNAHARSAGYASAREMIEEQNTQVRREADDFNRIMADARVPFRLQVRSRRRILV